MKAIIFAGVAALACGMGAASAAAQEAADWDLMVRPEEKLVAAYTEFDNGLMLAARCQDDVFQTLIAGLPEAPEADEFHKARRSLLIGVGDNEPSEYGFTLGEDRRVAFSELPAPLARRMREGGRMQIVAPGAAEDGRNLRYVIELPPSNAAIDQALTACGRPTSDPRDAQLAALADDGLPRHIGWERQPRVSYPEGRTYTAGFAVVSCLAQPSGELSDCVVETEHPVKGGFGEAALEGTRLGRLRNRMGGPVPLTQIVYRTNFTMSDDTDTGSRIRRRAR